MVKTYFIGEKLSKLLSKKNMSELALADIAGVSITTARAWVNNERALKVYGVKGLESLLQSKLV